MEDKSHQLSISLLLVLVLLVCCSGSQWVDKRVVQVQESELAAERSIYLVAILPNDIVYLPSFTKVGPALKLAMDKVVQQQLLPGFRLQLSFRNSRCSNIYAPYVAVEAYKLNQVHVFFGPSCDFALGNTASTIQRLEILNRSIKHPSLCQIIPPHYIDLLLNVQDI